MLAYILAAIVALISFIFLLAAFVFPKIHQQRDFLWSGVGLFYALTLWVCAERITGGVLLGQGASVALLGWLSFQTLTLRRAKSSLPQTSTAETSTVPSQPQSPEPPASEKTTKGSPISNFLNKIKPTPKSKRVTPPSQSATPSEPETNLNDFLDEEVVKEEGKSISEVELKPEVVQEPEPEVIPEPVVKTPPEPEPEVIPEPVVKTPPEPEPEVIPEPVVKTPPEPEPEVIPEPVVKTPPEPEPEVMPEPESEVLPEPVVETDPGQTISESNIEEEPIKSDADVAPSSSSPIEDSTESPETNLKQD